MTTPSRTFEALGSSEQIYGIPGLPFVPAIRVPAGHDTIYVSGVLGPTDAEVGIGAETRQLLENMKNVLELAGASLDDVVSVNKFMVDIARDNATVVEVLDEYFDHMPTSTTVEVARLVPEGLRIEISAVAVVAPQSNSSRT